MKILFFAFLATGFTACAPKPSEKARELYEQRQGEQQYDRESRLSKDGEPAVDSKSAVSGPPPHFEPQNVQRR
jgi:hypothetical protein